ncbi:microsomal signal peptidase 12kDa subunit [Dunaliella salina]|uniref:Signal peptidase complex subunit 1 n=1 Tax=Dunaliella salina TaxID=3046 RepID=A0ABQ7GKN0_DUNSA|nr:microsomal signal peptidase 12kDa subunit [Dunaliella salina]|eukprot:KAF5835121.1 microsomal signal peptidase 12kDa subunit [Dunaliella salina]
MDFRGQRNAEWLLVRILIVFAAVSFVAGYSQGDFQLMVNINAVGLLLTALLVIPSWPFFNRNPLPWLAPLHSAHEK